MKVIFGCFLSAFIACFFSYSYAQTASETIEGKVLTENQLPSETSTIVLLKAHDSSIVSSAVTDKNGQFKFNLPGYGSYLLLVTEIGYKKSYNGPYKVLPGKSFVCRDIILSPAVNQLKEVAVTGNKPAVEVKPGKIILNVQNSISAAGSSVFDILRQSPGVRVSDNNSVSIIGRQSALITIDGKPTNLSGDDLVAVLRSMQSNTIDRIELITSGSAKEDAAAGGIVNIVLKKGNNLGANATVTTSAGYGKYYKGNAGVVFNDRTDKVNVFGSYNYTDNKTFHDFVSDRDINFENVLSNYHVDYNSVQKMHNNSFSLGTDYFISPGQTVGFLVNGAFSNDNFIKDNSLKISNQSVPDSIITTNSNLNRHISRVNYNVNYAGKLDKAGKMLTANFNYYNYNRNSAEYITNEFYDAAGDTYRAPLLLQNLSPSNIHNWLSKIDFTDPLSKTSKFEAGIKYSNAVSNNDLIFGPLVNGIYTSDPEFSSHFVYTENVNAAYVNYENKFKQFNFTAGLRAEQTIAKGNSLTADHIVNSNYVDLFPHLLLTYAKDDKNDFSLIYSRGIKRPTYEEINPFLYYVDLYDYRAGNPGLKPEYSNSIELSYNYNKTFTTTLYTNIVSDAYEFNFYQQNDTSKVNITTNVNLGTIYNYGVRFFIPATFTSWWNATFNIDAAYQRYVSYPRNGNLNKGTQDVIFQSTQHFIISKTMTAELSGRYETPSFYGVNQFKSNYFADAGIAKQLFNKRGSLKLSVSDIFNTLRDRSHTDYENLDMSITDKKESQVARLTFSYRFGKTSLRTPVHHTGNEEEQTRTKSNN